MERIIKCRICGKEFTTRWPNRKYCSLSCRDAGERLRRMKWTAANPDYYTTYRRQTDQEKDGTKR